MLWWAYHDTTAQSTIKELNYAPLPEAFLTKIEGTLKDLAAELGLSHEALYRTLAKLEAAGRIRRGAATITLRSAAGG